MQLFFNRYFFFFYFAFGGISACKKSGTQNQVVNPPPPASFSFSGLKVNGNYNGFIYYNVNDTPVIQFAFSAPVNHASVNNSFSIKNKSGASIGFSTSFAKEDSVVIIRPSSSLAPITQYQVAVTTSLVNQSNGNLQSPINITLVTAIDSADKFPRITDSALLTLVQQQTVKYFFDFGHPVSGLARERNTSGDVVTTGGSGFGIMAMLVAVNRGFISRAQGLNRLTTIVNFLSNNAQLYHGAFSHWLNGSTGLTVPFGNNNGADIVETAYLMQGLLCARQYFDGGDANETALRTSINAIWNAIEWDWFTQNGTQQSLYWQWNSGFSSVADTWSIPVTGWNEALITYVLAASSTTHGISKTVYDNGWAKNGSMKNGKKFYGITLPLGPDFGGPLFFSHYSFLGINPHQLTDQYADYWTQDTAQAKINYTYCVFNPNKFNGYSNLCWGLTASDDNISGYAAHEPLNDLGVISPTAAISSLPYTPGESMNALRFFYYQLGDKLWGQYGFVDAFNLTDTWFADSYLAIDQGPEIVMIENYRSGLLWNLFMSCPEIKTGMKNLGFQSPDLQ